MKVVFWGSGKTAQRACKEIEQNPDIYQDEYICFVDSNIAVCGSVCWERDILQPCELKKVDFDYIVILSIYYKEIKKQIQQMEIIKSDNILNFDEYSRICYTQARYKERYSEGQTKKEDIFNKNKIAVYTMITGNYDALKEPEFKDESIDYICFTNNFELKSEIWNIEYINDTSLSDVMLARRIKFLTHEYLKEYDTSVWVDGKFKIIGDLREYIKEYEKQMPVLCFPHYKRNCVYSEASACIIANKGKKEQILKQIVDYYQASYPVDNGLYETGCIVRNHNDKRVIRLMEGWYKEINTYSYRDQISLPYVCWKNNFLPDICDMNIEKNKWLNFYSHNI